MQLDREELLDAIEEMIEDDDLEDALDWCDAHLRRFPDDPEALLLQGHTVAGLGDFEKAMTVYDRALSLVPDWEDAALARAGVLLELGDVAGARPILESLLERCPGDAHIHHTLAICYDLGGNELGAQRHYTEAARLMPHYHVPYRVSEEAFMEMADASLRSIPEEFRTQMTNLTISVKPHPSRAMRGASNAPISPLTLGFFDGTPISLRSMDAAADNFVAHVFLFKRNLERVCNDRAELKLQIDITLKHELAHFFGFEEEDMARLNLA